MVRGMERSITEDAESYVRSLLDAWLAPATGECLACYLDRVLERYDCDGDLRFAAHYRDLVAPRATQLERRLEAGGGYCDCEVLANVVQPAWHLWSTSREVELDGRTVVLEAEPPEGMPPCAGVRRGSTQPCVHWHRMWRPRRPYR